MKEICQVEGAGRSSRSNAGGLGIARDTVLQYLGSPGPSGHLAPHPSPSCTLLGIDRSADGRVPGKLRCAPLKADRPGKGRGYSMLKSYGVTAAVVPATGRFGTAPGNGRRPTGAVWAMRCRGRKAAGMRGQEQGLSVCSTYWRRHPFYLAQPSVRSAWKLHPRRMRLATTYRIPPKANSPRSKRCRSSSRPPGASWATGPGRRPSEHTPR